MKKLFAILAVAAVMTACNNGSEEKITTTIDSTATSNPAADAMKTDSSATKMMTDSLHKMTDSTHKITDSIKK
jgi:ABC-type uncharacterized transport system auxiliary subunit